MREATAFRSFHSSLPQRPSRNASSALKDFGLRWLDEALLKEVLEPLATLVFPSMLDGAALDWCHGYVASYEASSSSIAASEQTSAGDNEASTPQHRRRFNDKLNAHTDDSEVTLNVGLVDTFTGGELHFRHIRGVHGFEIDYIAGLWGVSSSCFIGVWLLCVTSVPRY